MKKVVESQVGQLDAMRWKKCSDKIDSEVKISETDEERWFFGSFESKIEV